MPSKACDQYSPHCGRRKLYRRLLACFLSLLIVILIVILIMWLVLRPTKPKFYLRDVTVSQFNLTQLPMAGNLLSSNLQVTISSHNPNGGIGVYYDHLDVYAVYKDQRVVKVQCLYSGIGLIDNTQFSFCSTDLTQVTIPTALPAGYQGHNDFAVWSPFLYGTAIPVSPYLAQALSQDDENAGLLLVDVRVDGKLRWKVGSWVSGHYHIYVNCPAFLTVGDGKGNGGGWALKLQHMVNCHVEV